MTFYGLDPQIGPECYNDDGKSEDVPVNDIETQRGNGDIPPLVLKLDLDLGGTR